MNEPLPVLDEVKKHDAVVARRQNKYFGLMSLEQIVQLAIIIATIGMFAEAVKTTQAENTRRIEVLESHEAAIDSQRDQMQQSISAIRESQGRTEAMVQDIKDEIQQRHLLP